jgi:hypothetical protein
MATESALVEIPPPDSTGRLRFGPFVMDLRTL